MKSSSVIAIIVALGMGVTTAALSQVSVETSVGASVEVSVDPSAILSSVSSELSSALSSVESEVSSTSSELSSALSSEEASSEMMSAEEIACSDIDQSDLLGSPMDADDLAAITSVTIFTVKDCSGLTVAMDPNAIAGFETSQAVIDALASSGETGAQIVAYSVDGTSLTIYVESRD